jgi:hypothetical protein
MVLGFRRIFEDDRCGATTAISISSESQNNYNSIPLCHQKARAKSDKTRTISRSQTNQNKRYQDRRNKDDKKETVTLMTTKEV